MKKLLFGLLVLLMSSKMFAQSGALYIKNNTACDVNVTMYAVSPCTLPPNGCGDLISNTFVVTAGSFRSFTAWTAFTPPGWAVMTTPVPGLCANFQWTSIDFTWSGCPAAWGCTPAGGSMGDTPAGCTSTSSTWAGGCFVPMVGSWSPAQCPPPFGMCDVGIDFH